MIVMGVDPGASTGVAVLEVDGRGGARWVDGRTVVSPDGACACEVMDIVARCRAEFVIIERPAGGIYQAARAAALLDSAVLAGMIEGRVMAWYGLADTSMPWRGTRAMHVTAPTWRGVLVGSQRATDQQIARMVAARVTGLPARTSVHVRDAIGCALWGAHPSSSRGDPRLMARPYQARLRGVAGRPARAAPGRS